MTRKGSQVRVLYGPPKKAQVRVGFLVDQRTKKQPPSILVADLVAKGFRMGNRRRAKGEGSVFQRKSDGRWIGQINLGPDERGIPQRKTVSARTQQEALKKFKAEQRLIDQGLPPSDDRITVGQLLDEWVTTVLPRQVAPSALSNYEWAVRLHINPMIGRKRVSKLTTLDVDRLIADKSKSLRPSSVRRVRSVLLAGLDQGVAWGKVSRNVAKESRAPKLTSQERRALTQDEARSLVASLSGDRLEALYIAALLLGLRRGEVLGLKWSDIDAKKHTVTIRQALKREDGHLVLGEVKTPKSRRSLHMPEELEAAFKAHRSRQAAERLKAGEHWKDSGLVFTTEIGTPIDTRNFYRGFVQTCEKAGIGKLRPHELRHSQATLSLAAGVPIEVVSRNLGHASIRVTADTYAHIGDAPRERATEAMADVLWGAEE